VPQLEFSAQSLIDAENARLEYHSFFVSIEAPEKGDEWAHAFEIELINKANQLKQNPKRYNYCYLYPFPTDNKTYRYFRCMWHTVFYFVRGNTVVVARIANSRSDFSKLNL
jgi:hypothetical protein